MRVATFLVSVVTAVTAISENVETVQDALSLLQHNARRFHKSAEGIEDGEPPAEAVERIRARREANRANPNREVTAQQKTRRQARRQAKRLAHAQAKAAGQRNFADNADCDICLAKCEEIFQDVFKQCMIDAECQPWQKEDGPDSDHCKRRCDRTGNWQREPCNRQCMCDADGLTGFLQTNDEAQPKAQPHWAEGLHRCRDSPIGQISDCQAVEEDRESISYDSIRKCAQAAVGANADTFNFYRTAKEFGKCDLKNCGSADLKLKTPPAEPESPGGHGSWKVFSTYCSALPETEHHATGTDLDGDNA